MEVRNLRGDEMEQAIVLADKTFRDTEHVSMGKAFPLVFSKYQTLAYGAFENGKLVSFFGLVPFQLKIGEKARLNVFSIGAVCTDPEYRGQGIASKVLAQIYKYIEEADASLLLVSGDRGLYRRNHCYPVGKGYTYLLNDWHQVEHAGVVRHGTTADYMRAFALKQQEEIRYESSIGEWKTLLAAGGYASIFKLKQSLFVLEEKSTVAGYVIAGLPEENNPNRTVLITEWGGSPSAVYAILMDILKKDEISSIKIKVPWQDPLNEPLTNFLEEEGSIGGTVCAVNPGRLLEQLMPYLEGKDPEVRMKLKVEELPSGKIELKYRREEWLLNKQEFGNLLFIPDANPIPKLFPIPLPTTEGLEYV